MIAPLTPRQREVLDFIERFIKENRYSPSYEEVAKGVGITSASTAHKYIRQLESKKYLRRTFKRSRSIELIEPSPLPEAIATLISEMETLLELVTLGKPYGEQLKKAKEAFDQARRSAQSDAA